MYGLPDDSQLQFFCSRTLENICFAENCVALGFDNRVGISIQSSYQHLWPGNTNSPTFRVLPPIETTVLQLLGHAVVTVKGDSEGTLTLEFDNSHVLRVFDDSSHYETYTMNDGEKEIYV